MKLFFLVSLIILSFAGYAQITNIDSCKILPYHTASFEGVTVQGMIDFDDRYKLKRMISDEKDAVIIRFHVTIDCDDCGIYTREIYGDTLSLQDLKVMSRQNARYIISFECITGKTKRGELISHKPFLFYVKP
jgi:hypothetical protein